MRWPRFMRRKAEERVGMSAWPLGVLSSGYGAAPSVAASESLAAVVACTELIAGSIASLPASLTVDTPDGCQDAPPTAAAWRILRRPNPWQSWPALMSWTVASVLLRGNAVARIDTDARGAVVGLTPIRWDWLLPSVVAGSSGPRLVYDVVQRTPETTALGLNGARLLDTDVLHVRSRSDAGLIGRSVLSRAAGVIGEGLQISQTANSLWQNQMRPSGVLTAPSYLTPEQRNRKDSWIADYSGALQAGRVPLLEGGWKFETVSMSSTDAEFLASRRNSTEEICRMFSVPSPLVQLPERSVPADVSAFTTLLGQFALSPMIELIESEFDNSILPQGMHLEVDADGLARGSFASSVSAIAALTQSGIITPNDARAALGWPPVDGGDVLRVGAAPSWPADSSGLPSVSPKPGPRGADGLPAPGTHANEGSGRGNGKANGAAAP
jgi:HK97 family phage portal protein